MSLVLCTALSATMVACSPAPAETDAPATTEAAAETPDGKTAEAPTEEAAETAAEPASDGTKNIYVIIKAMGNAYWAVLQNGAVKAGEDAGCNVIITGIPDEAQIENQITLLQNAVSANADAIVIAAADSVAEAPEIEKAYGSGIPIVLVDTMVETDQYSAAYLTDNVKAGETAAEELIRLLKEKGTPEDKEGSVAIQIGSAGSQTIIKRMEGFEAYWAANAPENWKLLLDDVKVNDGDISKAVGFGQDFLTTYDDLIAVFSPNNGSTVGFVTAIMEAQRTDITMVGFDFSPEMESMIRDGSYNVSTMLQRQYNMGYDGVMTALEMANGGSAPAEKDVDTGLVVVNADNVDSDEVKAATGN